MNFNLKKPLQVTSLALLTGLSLNAAAQTCLSADQYPDSWPNSRYTINTAAGTVLDTQTNLMWMRCSLGQTLASASCAGVANSGHDWQQALAAPIATNTTGFAGFNDWRLPNIKELASLAALNCTGPSINEIVFPNTANDYWSASPDANDSSIAWQLNFFSGNDGAFDRSNGSRVRLVRTGP